MNLIASGVALMENVWAVFHGKPRPAGGTVIVVPDFTGWCPPFPMEPSSPQEACRVNLPLLGHAYTPVW